MNEVMLTKLMPPGLQSGLLPRSRLIDVILRKKGTRILEITAPAGYGKTVLTLQLSRELNKPLVWIQLDRYDNDPAIFLHCLVEGLRRHWPGLGERVLQLTAQAGAAGKQPRFIASILVNDIIRAGAEPLLVLDDYHELEENTVHALVQELLEHLPPGIFIVIASRTALPFSLARLNISGAALHIGPAELCFTREEIAGLLEEIHGPQPPETVAEIEQYTGGWPAALELVGPLIYGNNIRELHEGEEKKELLFDYLAAEVLEKLPPLFRDFLLDSSVLDVLTPEQCNLFLERDDSASILEILDRKLLLLTPLMAEKENAYRCHQLFREFLMKRLGGKLSKMRHRAARLALINGDIEKAVEFFLQAGFDAECETVLKEACKKALSSGRWFTIAGWLEQLTGEQISGSPWLSYFLAVVEAYRGRLDEAEHWLENAADAFSASAVNTGLAECRLLQARLLRCRGNYRQSLVLLDEGAAGFTEQEAAQHFELHLERGLSMALSGEMQQADKLLGEVLLTAKRNGQFIAVTYLAETLGHLHYQQGRHALALRTYDDAIRFSADHSLPGYYIQDTIPYIYCDWGEMDKALEAAHKSIQAKEKYQLVETLPSAYTALSYVYFELGDFARAEELIRKALDLQYQYGAERYFLLLNQTMLAWCRFARGHWLEARQLLDSTLATAEQQVDLVCSLVQMLTGSVLALMGSLAEADVILRRAEVNLSRMNFKTRLCEAYKALAYVCHASADLKSFEKYAQKFLHLGSRLNYIGNALQPTADLLEPSLRYGLEQNVEVIYVQRMLVRLGNRAQKLLLELAEHPNPAVRQRVINPLTELAGDTALQALTMLSRDCTAAVRQSALAFIRSKAGPSMPGSTQTPGIQPGESRLQVRTFGTLRFFAGERELTGWRTRKTRELLGLLVHLQEPAGKERLMEELWPECDPQTGGALFRTTMHYLRRHLERESLPGIVCYKQDRYSMQPGACMVDFLIFEELVNTGFQEEPLQEVGVAFLSKAVDLYLGDYMTEPDYTWAVPRQVRLKHMYIDTLLAMSRYYCFRKKYSRAQSYLLKLKEADPLCEPAHRQLLKVYAGLGDRRALIEKHRDFKLLLLEETGLSPVQETEELYLRLVGT